MIGLLIQLWGANVAGTSEDETALRDEPEYTTSKRWVGGQEGKRRYLLLQPRIQLTARNPFPTSSPKSLHIVRRVCACFLIGAEQVHAYVTVFPHLVTFLNLSPSPLLFPEKNNTFHLCQSSLGTL